MKDSFFLYQYSGYYLANRTRVSTCSIRRQKLHCCCSDRKLGSVVISARNCRVDLKDDCDVVGGRDGGPRHCCCTLVKIGAGREIVRRASHNRRNGVGRGSSLQNECVPTATADIT
jgi:hypothetical protein